MTIHLELDDAQATRAREIIQTSFLQPQEDSGYDQMAAALPALHFMAIVLFDGEHHDPLLMIELNFDGAPGPFMAALELGYGPALRDLLRCSKRPRDATGPMFDALTAPDSRLPLAGYLEARAVRPMTPFRGARRMSRARIAAEAKVYMAAQDALGDGTAFAGQSAGAVHQHLRAQLAPLLTGPAPEEEPWRAHAADRLAFWGTVLALGLALALPGLVAGAVLHPVAVLAVLTAVNLVVLMAWRELRAVLRNLIPKGKAATRIAWAGSGVLAAVSLVLAALHRGGVLPAPAAVAGGGFGAVWAAFAVLILCGLASAVLILLALFAALRRREKTDPVHDPAVPGARTLAAMAAMAAREDRIGQNHMASLLIVKPGGLRMLALRVSHLLLAALARSKFSNGILGSMRTIHFAHWALISNGGRLLFVSNFDGSWDSYLSDFTEKASEGVNLAWANCIGFPEGAFILSGGSRNGRQFKAWARHSMAPTLFWFSAYRDLSVGEVHRNARIAAGLRRRTLSDAAIWARDL